MSDRHTAVVSDARLREVAEELREGREPQLLIEAWSDGTISIASRPSPSATWGPPIYSKEVS